MDKNITVIEGETKEIKVKAVYENKDATNLVSLDSDSSNFKGLVEVNNLSNGILPIKAGDAAEQNCVLVFRYGGRPAKKGEGESYVIKEINVRILPTMLMLIGQTPSLFKWEVGTNRKVTLRISKNGGSLNLTDPLLKISSKLGVTVIKRIDSDGILFDLTLVGLLPVGKDLPPIIDMLEFQYRSGRLEVPMAYNQEKTINFGITANTSALRFGDKLPFNWLTATWANGSNALPALVGAVPDWFPYFNVSPDGTLEVIDDEINRNASGRMNWKLTFRYEGLEWVHQTVLPFTILKAFGVGTIPTNLTGKVGDKGTLVFNTKYRGLDNADMYTIQPSSLDTGNGILKFGDVTRVDNKLVLPYEVLAVGRYTLSPYIVLSDGSSSNPLLIPNIAVSTESSVTSVSGTYPSGTNLKLGLGGSGTITFKLLNDKGKPVSGVKFTEVTKDELPANAINIGTNKPVDKGNGVYTLTYNSALVGWVTLKLKITYQGKAFVITLPKLMVIA